MYLLDYGWDEPLGRALRDNFDKMANHASRHDAVVFLGLGNKFNDEVLSWHGVNGKGVDDVLPAVLITNRHPSNFRESNVPWNRQRDHLVLIPLRNHCKTATDVVKLIEGIFRDIKAKKPLANFAVASEDRAGIKGALLDAVVLRPTFAGVGVDLKALLHRLRKSGRDGA